MFNVLVCCEESQAVCKAFRARGFNAFSADIQACSVCLIIGLCLGLWIGFFLKWQAEVNYIKIIEDYKRKNKKLIFFIRYKLEHITHEEYEEEVKNIEI